LNGEKKGLVYSISGWVNGNNDGSFGMTEQKVISLGRDALSLAETIAGVSAVVGVAVGLLLLAYGSNKTTTTGKSMIIHSAFALILASVIVGVIAAILAVI
jgi:flagellar biosynthesis protein FliQ